MLSETHKVNIFTSLPKQVTHNSKNYKVYVEYSELADITKLLVTNGVVITVGYHSDTLNDSESPVNMLFYQDKTHAGVIREIRGKRSDIILSLNLFVRKDQKINFKGLLENVLHDVEKWCMSTLRNHVDVISISPARDLSNLEQELVRKQIDIKIRHVVTYTEDVDTVDSMGITIDSVNYTLSEDE